MVGPGPRLSGWILVDAAHGVDSSQFEPFPDQFEHERSPRRAASEYCIPPGGEPASLGHAGSTDCGEWRGYGRAPTDTKDLLLTLLFAQLSEAKSLRDIEALLASQAARRYHSGLREVHRSTLADAAARRPVSVFTGLLSVMMASVARQYRRDLAGCVRLIDATSDPAEPAERAAGRGSPRIVCGAKVHVIYDR